MQRSVRAPACAANSMDFSHDRYSRRIGPDRALARLDRRSGGCRACCNRRAGDRSGRGQRGPAPDHDAPRFRPAQQSARGLDTSARGCVASRARYASHSRAARSRRARAAGSAPSHTPAAGVARQRTILIRTVSADYRAKELDRRNSTCSGPEIAPLRRPSDAPLRHTPAPDNGRREHDDCRYDLRGEACKQRGRIAPARTLQLGK